MIRFDAVTKHYRGAPRAALDAVTLEIGAGEFVFLVGASGSGKSSLLRLMLREERPSAGEIHVLGQRLTTISTRKVPYFRRSLGVVFQDFRLLPNKTVHDNVAFTLQVIGKSRGFIQTTVPDVLETVGLADKAQNYPNELSGGEQQRVAIARAVVNKPAILLADEPTGNLDPKTSDGIMAVLERINVAGTTVVMATHDVTIVDRLQKRVVELVAGRIIRDELEATYVTSSIALPPRNQLQGRPDAGPEVPLWARRGARSDPETGPTAWIRPKTPSTWQSPPAAVASPLAADRFEVDGAARSESKPDVMTPSAATPIQPPPRESLPVESLPGESLSRESLPTGSQPFGSAPAGVAVGPVSSGPVSSGPVSSGPVSSVAAPTPPSAGSPDAAPIWFRSETGPVLLPGEHAPWRAAPVAPPTQEHARGDSQALFVAPPVPAQTPAQRGWTSEDDDLDAASDVTDVTEAPAPPRRAAPLIEPIPAAPVGTAPAAVPLRPSPVTRMAAPPADVDDTGDPEGLARRLGKHRTVPLPDHLDFVTGLGLRPPRRDDDEVGPSS